jgi:RNA polymerase sigma-70 factor, ECF subfamily
MTTTGDTQAVWHTLHSRLRAFIAGRVDDPADVDDLVQEVFLRVHQHLPALQQHERLLPWIYQITRNAIADYYRAPVRRRETYLEPNADTDPSAAAGVTSIDDVAANPDEPLQELAACVRPLIEQLAPKYREALTLVELGGLSPIPFR